MWAAAHLRVCVDGGSNQLFDVLPRRQPDLDPEAVRVQHLPHAVIGACALCRCVRPCRMSQRPRYRTCALPLLPPPLTAVGTELGRFCRPRWAAQPADWGCTPPAVEWAAGDCSGWARGRAPATCLTAGQSRKLTMRPLGSGFF